MKAASLVVQSVSPNPILHHYMKTILNALLYDNIPNIWRHSVCPSGSTVRSLRKQTMRWMLEWKKFLLLLFFRMTPVVGKRAGSRSGQREPQTAVLIWQSLWQLHGDTLRKDYLLEEPIMQKYPGPATPAILSHWGFSETVWSLIEGTKRSRRY